MTAAATPPARTHEVSRFEYHLLRVLRFFLGHFPTDQGLSLLRSSIAAPTCLSRTAIRLAEETLAKGCVLFLARSGAWRNDRYLHEGQPITGRVWERIPLAERTLSFTPAVLRFVVWATSEKLPGTKEKWNPPAEGLTPADELFFYLAFEACRADPPLLDVLRHREAFATNPWAWLACPAEVAGHAEARPPSFDPLFVGERATILESLQPLFFQRWLNSERLKGKQSDWKQMRQQGRAELASLQAFLGAADRANRRDLARFVLQVNAALYTKDLTPTYWTGSLTAQGPPRLADRLDTQRAALAVPRQMAVFQAWAEQARHVSYFDEGYTASQLWKAEWEAASGDEIAARAERTIEAIEPLRTDPLPPEPQTGSSS